MANVRIPEFKDDRTASLAKPPGRGLKKNRSTMAYVSHECDIANHSRVLLARLRRPIANATLDFEPCTGYGPAGLREEPGNGRLQIRRGMG